MTGNPTEQAEKIFVRQLGFIGVGSTRIGFAVRDYVRAVAQRSRWTNENLLRPGEIGEYERRLVEEREARFAVMENQQLRAELATREGTLRLLPPQPQPPSRVNRAHESAGYGAWNASELCAPHALGCARRPIVQTDRNAVLYAMDAKPLCA